MSVAVQIPLQSLRTGESECAMELYPVKDAFYAEIDAAEAKANGEAPWQIREGCDYEYTLPEGMRLASMGPAPMEAPDAAIDAAIMQKLLPKPTGSRATQRRKGKFGRI